MKRIVLLDQGRAGVPLTERVLQVSDETTSLIADAVLRDVQTHCANVGHECHLIAVNLEVTVAAMVYDKVEPKRPAKAKGAGNGEA